MVAFLSFALGSLEQYLLYQRIATTPDQINQAIITALQNQLGTIVTETTKAVKRSLQEDVQTTVEKKSEAGRDSKMQKKVQRRPV